MQCESLLFQDTTPKGPKKKKSSRRRSRRLRSICACLCKQDMITGKQFGVPDTSRLLIIPTATFIRY